MMGIELDDELLESILAHSQTAPLKNFQRCPMRIDKMKSWNPDWLVLHHPEPEQLEVLFCKLTR